jgi:HrpA-like RNA helicase
MLPSLLSKGAVKKNNNIDCEDIKQLHNIRAIDYITNFIDRRLNTKRSSAKYIPKKLGHRVILLRSGTGSGKSTTIAPFLYKTFQSYVDKQIVITQPRVLTAVDKAQDMAHHFSGLILGQNIGYQTGSRTLKPAKKGITSMTPGILLNILANSTVEEIGRRYSFILIDEIHEKDINTETNLFLLKKFLKEYWKEPDCPFFILMSATFEPKPFIDYFDCPAGNFIEVEGRTFPIISHFPQYDVQNYLTFALHKALDLHVNNIKDLGKGGVQDIMIFVKNKTDAKVLMDDLNLFNTKTMTKGLEYSKQHIKNLEHSGGYPTKHYILPILLNRESFQEGGRDYRNMFSDIKYLKTPIYEMSDQGIGHNVQSWEPASRKVIVSTPIAETGITIGTLKYCIDTGWVLSPEFNPDYGVEILLNKPITRNMAEQRQGRVGRLDQGEWYPCYTKETYDALSSDLNSKFITDDITGFLLNIIVKETQTTLEQVNPSDCSEEEQKTLFRQYKLRPSWHKMVHLKTVDFKSLDFFTPPSSSGLCYSLEKLYVLGLLDINYNPTILGYHINLMRKVNIESIRMVFAGFSHDSNILDLITIAAFLQVGRRNICGRKYKLRNPANLEESTSRFYNQVLIADEFIDSLFLWNEFMEQVEKIEDMVKDGSKIKFSIDYVSDWCKSNDIKYPGLIDVIYVRDEIIQSLIAVGINPYWNGLGVETGTYNLNQIFKENLEEGVEEIKKIKMCIYEGYKLNLAQWNKHINSYEMIHRPIKIKVKSPIVNEIQGEQTRPQIIALSSVIIQADFNIISYKFQSSGCISVLDGFIDVDILFAKK